MPLLPKELDVFPDDLLACENAAAMAAPWWVAQTRSRQEKALARQLLNLHVPFYLPQIKKTFEIQGRRFESYVPTFGGYVFVRADPAQYDQALGTKRIVRFLPVRDQQLLHAQLQQIKRVIDTNLPLYPEERLVASRKVRIAGGPLMGLVGTILRRKNSLRFFVSVDIIQQGVSAEVAAELLEPVEE